MNGLESIHWNQWNGNGFLVWQPLVPMEWQWFFSMATIGTNGMVMVFNGLQPLVKRWDGSDPSLWSMPRPPLEALVLIILYS